MPNYRIIVEYDGTNFFGWQLQSNRRTVQGEIENALETLSRGRLVRIHGAGRTDAGVHAHGQVASFVLEREWDCRQLKDAINGNTGADIFVHNCNLVAGDFHARFSAKRRMYRYFCRLDDSIMDRMYVWRIARSVSVAKLRQCAPVLLGEHDFSSFCKLTPDQQDRRCIVYQSEWIKRGNFVIFTVEANRFLQHLIRYLVGTMMAVARGNLSVHDFETILGKCDPEAKIFKAPAHGLYLERVSY